MLDAGANRGRFSKHIAALFPVRPLAIEANPALAAQLIDEGMQVMECALGAKNGEVNFYLGTNDEASSTHRPGSASAHLVVKECVRVRMKTMYAVLEETRLSQLVCVKLDIEGDEVSVIRSVAASVDRICPQWTVEFHDDQQFQLNDPHEVDEAITVMTQAGFSHLIRNWPSRTNVLFVDRRALRISWTTWLCLKVRYQYLAVVWRKLTGLR